MDDDHIDQLINDARNAGLERNREAFEALWTRHGFVDGQDLDELIARAMLDELFPAAQERLKLIVLAYILSARGVRLGVNTRLEELSAEERDSHERALNGCEETYVAVRAAYETERQKLTQLQQHIVERLVEVKFNR